MQRQQVGFGFFVGALALVGMIVIVFAGIEKRMLNLRAALGFRNCP